MNGNYIPCGFVFRFLLSFTSSAFLRKSSEVLIQVNLKIFFFKTRGHYFDAVILSLFL